MARMPVLMRVLVCSTLLAFATSATAAVDMFLKIDGIKGDAVVKGHEGEIVIESFQWGAGPKEGKKGDKVCASDITMTKLVDRATPGLLSAAFVGANIPTATITVAKAAGAGLQDFLTITLTNASVSRVSHSVGAGSPSEAISLSFASAVLSLRPQNPDGTLGTAITANVTRAC